MKGAGVKPPPFMVGIIVVNDYFAVLLLGRVVGKLVIANPGLKGHPGNGDAWWVWGWRSGESGRLPPMWPGFNSDMVSYMWAEFVVGSRPCSEAFFRALRLSSVPHSKLQFDHDRGPHENQLRLMWLPP